MLKVWKPRSSDATDTALFVGAEGSEVLEPWCREKIERALGKEGGLAEDEARQIALTVEQKLLQLGLKRVSTVLIRELVNAELLERGKLTQHARQNLIAIPKYDLKQVLKAKSCENANISNNNPEFLNLYVAEQVWKQFALQEVFSPSVATAHLDGLIHIHDLGYPTRAYCSSHSLEYLKKYGLELAGLDSHSAPPKYARTLTGHLNTFLASMQAYFAGALGIGFLNIFYAPLTEGLSDEELLQEAQYLIFSASQNAFSRGGQTLFQDYMVHSGVPTYLKDVPAIGPGGQYTGKTYGQYEAEAQRFCKALLEIWRRGDKYGIPFPFPTCRFVVTERTLQDPKQRRLFEQACEVASHNGGVYFIFDRDESEAQLAQCCRLKTKIDDKYMLQHPESMRFVALQNVTINLPRCAYTASAIDELYKNIEHALHLAMKAHVQKRQFLKSLTAQGGPLHSLAVPAQDGRPYVDLNRATCIVGLIGLNECLKVITGKELHEDRSALREGLKLVRMMQLKAKKLGEQFGLGFVGLEETPAESACRRLAKLDVQKFGSKAYVQGSIENDAPFYTNSVHIKADASISLIERIRMQSMFHPMLESGAIVHAFVGEERPPAASIAELIEKTWRLSQCSQLVISPEFSFCYDCKRQSAGIHLTCPYCGSDGVFAMTRIVGYYSRIDSWNKSKLEELKARQSGTYSLTPAG